MPLADKLLKGINKLMKKLFFVPFILSLLILVGCGEEATSPLAGATDGGQGDNVSGQVVAGNISIVNNTGYTFTELYSTASSSSSFGSELLGGMRVDDGAGISLDIGNINETQDLLIVDSDGDTYSLLGLSIIDGGSVTLMLVDNGGVAAPQALIYDGAGNEVSSVLGELIPNGNADATGYNTNGNYSFTVNNNSDYDIYSIHVGISNASSGYDIDILPEILPAGYSMDVAGFATQGDWHNTEWTLYITDVDGDTSASFDSFNPWTVTAADVQWDSNSGGYVVSFMY